MANMQVASQSDDNEHLYGAGSAALEAAGSAPLIVPPIAGDLVSGDKVYGDKIAGNKIIYTGDQAYDVSDLTNPYVGLRSFTYADRALYAGRQSFAIELADRLIETGPNLLLIQGASGSGKSSFIQAGLIPQLEQAYRERQHKELRHTLVRPSKQPFSQLQLALKTLGLPPAIDTIVATEAALHLIVVDQFEELFTQSEKAQADAFVEACYALPPFHQSQLLIIVALRVDYLPQLFQTYSRLYEQLQKQAVNIYAMSEENLRQAILQPLRSTHGDQHRGFEPALLDRLVNDTLGDPAALPLLQFTLQDLWEHGKLVSAAYQNLSAAISTRATEIYRYWFYQTSRQRSRSAEEQRQLMRIMLQLVHVGQLADGQHDARIRRTVPELIGYEPERRLIIEDLVAARLLSTSTEQRLVNGAHVEVEVVDIIHETLIDNWRELRTAIRQNREMLQQQAMFEIALGQWERNQKNDEYLLDGSRLREAESIRNQGNLFLSPQAVELIERSIAQRQKREQDRVLLQEQQRNARRLRRFLVIVATLLVIAVAASAIAVVNLRGANAARLIAEAERARADQLARAGEALAELTHRPERALDLMLTALPSQYPTFSATLTYDPLVSQALYAVTDQARIRRVFGGIKARVWSANWTADAKTLLAVVSDRSPGSEFGVVAWNTDSGKQLAYHTIDVAPEAQAQFSPNRKWLAIQRGDGTIRCFDTSTLQMLRVPRGETLASRIAWSGDSQRLLLADSSHQLRIWDVQLNTIQIVPISTPRMSQIAWSDAGTQVLIGNSDGTVIAFDLTTLAASPMPAIQSSEITALAWWADNHSVLTGDVDGLIVVRDAATGQERRRLVGHRGAVHTIAVASTGQLAVSGGTDGIVRIWDLSSGRLFYQLYGHTSAISSVAWSVNGQHILSAAEDGSLRLWDTASGLLMSTVSDTGSAAVWAVAWSPDQTHLAAGDEHGVVKIWDTASGQQPKILSVDGLVHTLRWSPDGRRLAVGDDHGLVTLVDSSLETVVWRYRHRAAVWSVAWSTRGDRLATSSQDATVVILSADTGQIQTPLQADTPFVRAIAWAPDDTVLAVGDKFGAIHFWRTDDGSILPWHGVQRAGIRSIAWSPDGRRIATAGDDNRAVIWDTASDTELFVLTGHRDAIRTVIWSADGQRIATSGDDGTIRFWEAKDGSEIYAITGSTAPIWSSAWSSDGHLLVTGDQAGAVRIWQLDPTRMIQAIRERSCMLQAGQSSQTIQCASPSS